MYIYDNTKGVWWNDINRQWGKFDDATSFPNVEVAWYIIDVIRQLIIPGEDDREMYVFQRC